MIAPTVYNIKELLRTPAKVYHCWPKIGQDLVRLHNTQAALEDELLLSVSLQKEFDVIFTTRMF